MDKAGVVQSPQDAAPQVLFCMTHSAAGGLRELWNDLATGLRDRGISAGLLAFAPPSARQGIDTGSGIWDFVQPVPPRGAVGALRLLFALIAFLRRSRPRVVVTAMPACNALMPLAVFIARVPTAVLISHHTPANTHGRLARWLDGFSGRLRCVHAIISVSNAVARSLVGKAQSYRAKQIVITNALPVSVEGLIDELALERSCHTFARKIVALGRLTAQKNYPQLIAAMSSLDATLDIIGAGEDEEKLRALAQIHGLGEKVRFVGQVERSQALRMAAMADVFVQVSHYEGHSLALIEAARLGLPMVVSDVPVQVEGVTASDGTRCAQIVPIGDVHCLASALQTLLDDERSRQEWSTRAMQLGKEQTNQRMVDAYELLIRQTGFHGDHALWGQA